MIDIHEIVNGSHRAHGESVGVSSSTISHLENTQRSRKKEKKEKKANSNATKQTTQTLCISEYSCCSALVCWHRALHSALVSCLRSLAPTPSKTAASRPAIPNRWSDRRATVPCAAHDANDRTTPTLWQATDSSWRAQSVDERMNDVLLTTQ